MKSEIGCGKKALFGLKSCQDLENRAGHPHQELPGVPPRGIRVGVSTKHRFHF